jgi:TonB-linked SusC/RagA family outer membrane protein
MMFMRCIQLVFAACRNLLHRNSKTLFNLLFIFIFLFSGFPSLLADTGPDFNMSNDNTGIIAPVEATQEGIVVTGTVSDEFGPIPGVNILIKGTQQGTVTDASGNFSITVPGKQSVLQFKFLGMNNQEVVVGNRTVFNITMTENVSELTEVVVVGYGVQKKESSVASIAQVSGNDMLKMNATNVTNALAGQVAGVSIVQNSGQPGSDAGKIFIRGVSSWQSSDPLVLVDGIERNFNQIDPNEIETLSVLKDASATAVFGVRGANGVILITTRRGKKGEVKVSGSAELTIKEPINVLKPMNSYQTALVMNEANRNDNNWGSLWSNEMLAHWRDQDLPWLYPNTSWQDEMLKKNAFSNKYNVNISGGTDFARVFASLSYLFDGDIINTQKQPDYDPEWKFNRYNYRFNIDLDLTKSTLLSLDAGGFISIMNRPNETNNQRLLRNIFMLGPMEIPPYYPAEVLNLYPDPSRPDQTGDRIAGTGVTNAENPMLANNYSGQASIKTTNLDATITLKQNLDFITKGLSINGKVGYTHVLSYSRSWGLDVIAWRLNGDASWSRFKGRTNSIDPEQAATPVTYNGEGVNGDPFRSWYFEGAINYARTFDKHSFTGLLLGLRNKRQNNVAFPSYEEGIVGRITYDFDSRYSTEVNLGYNGSEQFSPQNRYGFFPSYGLTWNLHNEKFFKPFKPVIQRLKIRATYGETGSDYSPNRWLYTSSYTTQNNAHGGWDKYSPGVNPGVGTDTSYPLSIIEENAANANVTWERALKQNIAFEMAFLKENRFVLNLDFFKEHRSHILLSRNAVPEWFGVGMKQQNLGETKTQGYEIELKYQHTIGGFYYWVKPAIWFSDNRIIARDDPMYKPEYQKQAGFRINQLFGTISSGKPSHLIQNADELMTAARYGGGVMGVGDVMYIDFNGDGVIDTNDQLPLGYSQRNPMYNYSLNGGFKYSNFTFDFLIQAVSHYSRVTIDAFAWPLHRLAPHAFEYQLDRWTPDNPYADYPQFRFDANRGHNNLADAQVRTINTYDASYLRLKSASFTYNIPKNLTGKMRLQNMSVYLRGNNLFTWAPNFPLTDPEGTDSAGSNLTNGYYPLTRRITLGTQITF